MRSRSSTAASRAAVEGPSLNTAIAQRRSGAIETVRWIMLALWIFVMAVAVVAGDRGSSLSALESGLNSGSVTRVFVTPGMPADAEGIVAQALYWRSGLRNYHAEVQMVTPGSAGASQGSSSLDNSPAGIEPAGQDTAVRSGHDIATEIAHMYPTITITRIPQRLSFGEVYRVQVPTWLLAFALFGAVGTLMVLASGPEPWRATRWAWFWLITSVIGPPLFLILSGPAPLLRSPRNPSRRLRGGWAFVIMLIFGSAVGSVLFR